MQMVSGSDKKIYWVDNGLLNANTAQYTGNKGLLLENAVFRELYRQYGNIYNQNIYYYTDTSAECDFSEGRLEMDQDVIPVQELRIQLSVPQRKHCQQQVQRIKRTRLRLSD